MCIAIHVLNSDLFQCVFHIQKLKNDDPLQRAQNIIAKVATPSRVEASVLATHFPARADSIIRKGNWKRKKTSKDERPTKITVVLLEKFSSSVPKGKVRQELASSGRILSIRFTPTMSSQSIREKIEGAFNINYFTVLECDSNSHQLIKAAEQDLSGFEVVSRKGSLYLCESFPEVN